VFDNDDGVPQIGKPVQHFEQFTHIVEVQACGRLVQQIKRASGLALAQFPRQLHPLRLAATERGCALTQVNVAQAHIDQRLELLTDLGNISQNGERVFDGQFQYVSNGVALELDGQRLLVITPAIADFALHINVGHEVHFNPPLAVALAGLATPPADIEAEAARLVAALASFGQHGKEVADGREDLRVGGRIGARRAANRRLIDAHHFIDLLGAGQRFMRARLLARAVDGLRQ